MRTLTAEEMFSGIKKSIQRAATRKVEDEDYEYALAQLQAEDKSDQFDYNEDANGGRWWED